ncbi:ATP synthase F1 subunit epsilon [bacterium]|nr:ATP synthase F1 subunit epsilon [bacterium]
MLLDILTPEKLLFEGKIKSVKLPGTNGEFEILNNHAPIISTLSKGEICVTNSKNDKEIFNINGGVIEMQNNKIIVLAD